MPIDEILRNSAPAIGGLLVIATALMGTRFARRSRSRPPVAHPAVHDPAE
jgi:hypothetical protein